jgi:hypothetical protein
MANVSPSPLQTWKPFLIQLQQSTQKLGIILRVRHSDRTLHLLLEGAGVSSRKQWVAQVETLLKNHPVDSSTIQILMYGRMNGKRYPAWKASISLSQVPSDSQNINSQNINSQTADSPVAFHGSTRGKQRLSRWIVRPLRPAGGGFKEVIESPVSPVSESVPRFPQLLEINAELGTLGSQQWLARSILGLFGVAIGLYLYIGTWFIPQQARLWAELQPQLDRIAAVQPRNLKEMETVLQEMEETIVQLRKFSPLSGVFYQRARAQLQILNDRHQQLQHRQEIEQAGQAYLGQAKRLAAQATLLLEAKPSPPSPEEWRSIQQNWLVALYWLNQVPGQTFAIQERNQLLRRYQQTYQQIQQDAENSFQFSGNL